MAGRSEWLRCSSVFFDGTTALGVLLWSCQHWVSGTALGLPIILLCHSLGFIALAFLWTEHLFAKPQTYRNAVFAMILSVLASTVVGFLVWGRQLEGLGVTQIAIWQGFQGLPLLSLAVGRRLALRFDTMGLEIIVGGVVLLMAPILIEGALGEARNPETARLMINSGLGASPWSTASQDFLALDLFKVESMYREYRIGEKIYLAPKVWDSLPVMLALSGLILALGGIIRGGRHLWCRFWTTVT